ncbi:MAG: hypothetical protein KME29_03860 [Calothrix sp. FI2-JRJ7]|jgi:hypothetical protein|nr:hypothetical protein [Calothrix sp. FI2-JRJ7]MBW4598756.1 hypothetical protein [Calothrix sp. FI2-JRJ7]
MTLPANFNKWRHFLSVVTQIQNRIVKEDFRDVSDDEEWQPTIGTPRASLRTACTIQATDSQPMVILKLVLYYIILRKAQDLQIPYYGIPAGALQAQRKFRPQVTLYFLQSALTVGKNETPVTGEISWRIMNETSESLTKSEVERIANLVKLNFGGTTPFTWKKGKVLVSYTDWNQGLQLQLLCRTDEEGERVIREVLKVHGASFISKKMNVVTNADPTDKYPTTPGNEVILGETIKQQRERPNEDVIFQYATLTLHGRPRPVHLYDRTLRLSDCVVR